MLEELRNDPSEYVRRSVANNLNDISKDHPDQVIALCKRWKKGASPEREWIIRHATRTLVKASHPDVFGLLGYTENPDLDLLSLKVAPAKIQLGESIEFNASLKSTGKTKQQVIVDYVVHHMKANGQTSPKVFKLKALTIAPGETVELTKRHAIKPISTRKYYPGEHAIGFMVNGKTLDLCNFQLD